MNIDGLTPSQKRAAIAKACGWVLWPYVVINGRRIERETWVDPQCAKLFTADEAPGGHYAGYMPPDYLNDLNAMHEAEKVLGEQQMQEYASHLLFLTDTWPLLATAAQRADAFLLSLP